MNEITSIGFALDPNNTPSFLLDWEITKRCNMSCTYCASDPIDGGHNNSTPHPPKDECIKSIDFMYEYVDLYMRHKKVTQRKVVLNVYGGESLFHPDIVEILTECRKKYEKYIGKWDLTITCTTNGIVGPKLWEEVVPLIDEFTLSYHTEANEKQRQQYIDNALYLRDQNKRFKCTILMHNNPELFNHAEEVIEYCKLNNLRHVAKPLDNVFDEWKYSPEQYERLKSYWSGKVSGPNKEADSMQVKGIDTSKPVQSIREGRACCGGRKLSINCDVKSSMSFVPAQDFRGWSCSVNWFFLYVRQLTGQVFTNKDCKTSYLTNEVEPIGYLNSADQILSDLKNLLDSKSMPVIQCVKNVCLCGFCAPKSKNVSDFSNLIARHISGDVLRW